MWDDHITCQHGEGSIGCMGISISQNKLYSGVVGLEGAVAGNETRQGV